MFKINLNGKELEVSNEQTGKDVASFDETLNLKEIIAYKLNAKTYDLFHKIHEDGEISFLTIHDDESKDILNHSTSHLLAEAVLSLFPEAKLGIGPSIENGFYYDIDFGTYILKEEDLEKISLKMKEFSKKNQYIIRNEISKQEALELFKDNPYKIELINELNDDETISYYKQGDFIDLCTGPHLPSTGLIKNFSLDVIAGAYWRGDSNNKQLTRIYGTSCFTKEELEHLHHIKEEAKKRDHRKIGKELGLYMISEYGPGFPFFLPNGMKLRREIEYFVHKMLDKHDYKMISTPIILSKELWLTSGHWDHYKENMYTTKIDEKDYAIKPMNCPGALIVYNSELHSYKDLPLRYAELGLVHRHEASGALNGLFRVRCFTQDDAHIFCTKDQLQDEIVSLLKLYDEFYSTFGLDYYIVVSTKPDKDYIGDDEVWELSENILKEACLKSNKEFKINPGDGAFYGPKLDFKLKDCMGRIWQCGTIQLDMNLPERFDCTYINDKGEKERPIMLHRAILGSFERFIGIITEHFAGNFPLWFNPRQVNVLPVNNTYHLEYAEHVKKILENEGIRVELDKREEKLGYRMRNSIINKTCYTLVIGDKEKENGTVTYRRYGTEEQISISLNDFITMLHDEIKEKKFLIDPKES